MVHRYRALLILFLEPRLWPNTLFTQIEGPMNEAIDLKVVHNYGHGGAGITLHWGCAGDAVGLARQLL